MDLYKNTLPRCRFLLYMAWGMLLGSLILNGYLLYGIVYFFMQDSFSFMMGIILIFLVPVTITLSLITWAMINSLRKQRKKPAIFFLVTSFPGMITAGILHNATPLWPFLLLFFILLLSASVMCMRNEQTEKDQ